MSKQVGFHINNEGKVLPCYSSKKPCKFAKDENTGEPFINREDAERAAQKIKQKNKANAAPQQKLPVKNNLNSSLSKLSNEGVKVKSVKSIVNEDFNQKIDNNISTVDVLEEKPNKDFLQSIMNGDYSFKKMK